MFRLQSRQGYPANLFCSPIAINYPVSFAQNTCTFVRLELWHLQVISQQCTLHCGLIGKLMSMMLLTKTNERTTRTYFIRGWTVSDTYCTALTARARCKQCCSQTCFRHVYTPRDLHAEDHKK